MHDPVWRHFHTQARRFSTKAEGPAPPGSCPTPGQGEDRGDGLQYGPMDFSEDLDSISPRASESLGMAAGVPSHSPFPVKTYSEASHTFFISTLPEQTTTRKGSSTVNQW